jgi:hypothetical protein
MPTSAQPDQPAASAPLTRRIPGATAGAFGDAQPAAEPAPLTRRTPGAGPGAHAAPTAPGYGGSPEHGRPTAGGASARPAQDGAESNGRSGSAPLRRRVRGATLRATWGEGSREDTERPPAPRPAADAEAVRSELDEFEAAVERANRDSRTTTGPDDIEAAVARANRDTRSTSDAGFQEGAEE